MMLLNNIKPYVLIILGLAILYLTNSNRLDITGIVFFIIVGSLMLGYIFIQQRNKNKIENGEKASGKILRIVQIEKNDKKGLELVIEVNNNIDTPLITARTFTNIELYKEGSEVQLILNKKNLDLSLVMPLNN